MKGLLIGLTGGIGSGKSAAADHFARLGAAVIDSDAIAHELTRPGGAAMPAIEAAFGESVVSADGALDRGAMRRLVFTDPAQRTRLESILHPMIRSVSDARRDDAWAAGVPYVVMVIPLLVEAGINKDASRGRFDRVAVIDCPEALQVARVMTRNGLAETEVRAIMAAQASRAERLAVADDVVANDGSIVQLQHRIAGLHGNYVALAAKARGGG